MDQITGALIGIALVLSAVFVPMAFFGGSTGVIYRQFSITIVSAMAAVGGGGHVLTPALCATMLKPDIRASGDRRGFFGWFNRMFNRGTGGYIKGGRHPAPARSLRFLVIYLMIVVGWACCSRACRPPSCRTRTRA
jgi:multidrug efflux pump